MWEINLGYQGDLCHNVNVITYMVFLEPNLIVCFIFQDSERIIRFTQQNKNRNNVKKQSSYVGHYKYVYVRYTNHNENSGHKNIEAFQRGDLFKPGTNAICIIILRCISVVHQGSTFQTRIREYFDKYVELKVIDEYVQSSEGKRVSTDAYFIDFFVFVFVLFCFLR